MGMNESIKRRAPQVVAGSGLVTVALAGFLSGNLDGTLESGSRALLLISGVCMLLGTASEAMRADTERTDGPERRPIVDGLSLLSGVFLLVATVLIVAF